MIHLLLSLSYSFSSRSIGIFADDSNCSVTNVLIKNLTVVIDSHTCNQWGSNYAVHSGLWLFDKGGRFDNIRMQDTSIVCKQQGKTYSSDLVCNRAASPFCSTGDR